MHISRETMQLTRQPGTIKLSGEGMVERIRMTIAEQHRDLMASSSTDESGSQGCAVSTDEASETSTCTDVEESSVGSIHPVVVVEEEETSNNSNNNNKSRIKIHVKAPGSSGLRASLFLSTASRGGASATVLQKKEGSTTPATALTLTSAALCSKQLEQPPTLATATATTTRSKIRIPVRALVRSQGSKCLMRDSRLSSFLDVSSDPEEHANSNSGEQKVERQRRSRTPTRRTSRNIGLGGSSHHSRLGFGNRGSQHRASLKSNNSSQHSTATSCSSHHSLSSSHHSLSSNNNNNNNNTTPASSHNLRRHSAHCQGNNSNNNSLDGPSTSRRHSSLHSHSPNVNGNNNNNNSLSLSQHAPRRRSSHGHALSGSNHCTAPRGRNSSSHSSGGNSTGSSNNKAHAAAKTNKNKNNSLNSQSCHSPRRSRMLLFGGCHHDGSSSSTTSTTTASTSSSSTTTGTAATDRPTLDRRAAFQSSRGARALVSTRFLHQSAMTTDDDLFNEYDKICQDFAEDDDDVVVQPHNNNNDPVSTAETPAVVKDEAANTKQQQQQQQQLEQEPRPPLRRRNSGLAILKEECFSNYDQIIEEFEGSETKDEGAEEEQHMTVTETTTGAAEEAASAEYPSSAEATPSVPSTS